MSNQKLTDAAEYPEPPPEYPDEMCHCKDIRVAHTAGDHYEERREYWMEEVRSE